MSYEGTVVNGVIVPDGSPALPEGARVRFDLEDDDTDPPPEPYDREAELAILRESIREAKAGLGRPFLEVMAEVAAKYNLPPVDRK